MTQTFIVTTPASNGGAVCAAANGTTITVSCNTNACRMFVYACVFARVFMPSTLSRWEARGRGRLCRRGSSSLQRIHPKWIRGTVAIWLKCRIRAEKEAFFIVPCDVPGLRGLWIVAVGDRWFFGPRFDYYGNQIWCCSVLLCKTFSRVFLRAGRLSFLRNGVVQAKRASKSTLFVASVLPRGALKKTNKPKNYQETATSRPKLCDIY